ncbi:MAG: FAD-dependent oxidoreductase [Lachnospiraceae bacterium]|nr:FAD-dependent oxidoreductase [Candidatus Minthocola equi]
MYDIIIVGGGPAGLTAGLYGLRSGKKVLILEKNVFGGQITNSPKVENIPGFTSISGDEFATLYLDQVIAQGGDVQFEEVTGVEAIEGKFLVHTASDATFEGLSVVLATGTKHRTFGFDGEDDLIGNGVHFCAVCDGDFYAGKRVVMIGGGNSAFVEANLLVDIAGHLTILQDLPYFTADEKLRQQVLSHENIETHVGTKVLGYETEDGKLIGVRYLEDGTEHVEKCDGVFLAIGLIPDNGAFADLAELDKAGYFIVGEDALSRTPGIFVAGDCRTKTLRQVTTACADGAIAAIAACNYLR